VPNIEWVTAVNFEEPNIGDRAMRSAAIGGLREEITGLIPWADQEAFDVVDVPSTGD
jgi:hypothetical protein